MIFLLALTKINRAEKVLEEILAWICKACCWKLHICRGCVCVCVQSHGSCVYLCKMALRRSTFYYSNIWFLKLLEEQSQYHRYTSLFCRQKNHYRIFHHFWDPLAFCIPWTLERDISSCDSNILKPVLTIKLLGAGGSSFFRSYGPYFLANFDNLEYLDRKVKEKNEKEGVLNVMEVENACFDLLTLGCTGGVEVDASSSKVFFFSEFWKEDFRTELSTWAALQN